MGEWASLAGELLSLLHGLAGLPVCPGDWVWTITAAGVVLAGPAVLAAALVALTRRFIGNRYTVGTLLPFAVLGVLGFGVLPLLGFAGAATALRRAALGTGGSGLSGSDVADLQDSYCFLPAQASYLGGGRSVSTALAALPGPDWLLGGRVMVLLVALPVFALLLTWGLARLAVRRGPSWPGRLLVLPFLILVVGTLPLDEGVVSQLWVGYTAGVVPGLFLVLLIGRPRWSVIRRGQTATPAGPQAPPAPEHRPRPGPQPEWRPERSQQQLPPRRPASAGRPPSHTLALPQPDGGPAADPTAGRTSGGTAMGPPRPATAPPGGSAPLASAPGPLPPTLAAGMAGAAGDAGAGGGAGTTARAGTARFRRLRQLGEGGFGDVWLAVDTVLGREVAIKVARAPDADTEQRIRREARSLAAVDHPHCVRVYDILSGLDDLPGLAIIMEYLPGPSLAQQVRSFGPLSDTAGAHLWSTLAGALDAAHRRGVLHRDVKPSNVILDESGHAHLIDFGIARSATDPTLTATGIVIGTPDYLAPEAAAGSPAGPGTDSWQLAATINYALSGHPPRGERDSAVAALQAAANREPATELPQRSTHCGLLRRALHPDAGRRPALAQVQAELAEWLARTGRPAEGPITRTLAAPGEP